MTIPWWAAWLALSSAFLVGFITAAVLRGNDEAPPK
jgi:hypothetical protein